MYLKIISASEIERYAYCPLNWWRSVEGINGKSDGLVEGVKKHIERSEEVGAVQKKEKRDIAFTMHMLITCIFAVSLLFLSVLFFRPYAEGGKEAWKTATLILMIGSVLSFTVSLLFFSIAYKNYKSAKKLRIEHSIIEGEIEYLDSEKNKPLTSEKYFIRGKPDYIIKKENNYIPIELKTGRVPKGPLFSHILQLATYCLLLEDKFGTSPPYGILEYEGKLRGSEEITTKMQYKIEYTMELKKIVLETIEKMQRIYETKDAHRNHNKVGKCRHCSRKDGCPERLE